MSKSLIMSVVIDVIGDNGGIAARNAGELQVSSRLLPASDKQDNNDNKITIEVTGQPLGPDCYRVIDVIDPVSSEDPKATFDNQGGLTDRSGKGGNDPEGDQAHIIFHLVTWEI